MLRVYPTPFLISPGKLGYWHVGFVYFAVALLLEPLRLIFVGDGCFASIQSPIQHQEEISAD